MKASHGLSAKTRAEIGAILSLFPAVDKAVLFGSRAKATHKPGSDIDLALVGAGLDWRMVGRIYDAFEDSHLPHRVSLVVLDSKTDPEVAGHIRRVGISLFQREPAGAELARP